jgi:hypothetical protein
MIDLGSMQDIYFRKLKWVYDIDDFSIQNVFYKNNEEYYTQARSFNGEVLPIDHYKLFPGELVLDFEHDTKLFPTHSVMSLCQSIELFCYSYDINCYSFVSGGSGIHMHMFCKDCNEKELLFEILKKNFKLEHYMFLNLLDNHIINGSHLIRAPGGRKFNRFGCSYKSFIETFGCLKYRVVSQKDMITFPSLKDMKLWEYQTDLNLLSSDELAELI